jgi:UDP-N-acetyl-2-amino-2-deoxyglucuronate dehydrogenase
MQHRFDEPVLLLQKAIAAGQLGRLLWGAARTIWYRDDQYYANPWRGTWQFDGGGALINQSIHYIDLLISVLGDVQSVSAKCRTRLHQQIEVEDVGVANLEFVNGTIGTIEGTTAAYPGLYAELAIFGEKGTVIIRNDQLLFYRLQNGALPSFDVLLQPEKANALHLDATISDASHRRQYQDFIAAIQEDRKPLVSGEDALSSLKVIKAIYQASQEKREIYL